MILLEEIVVTAQKRESTVETTPISITALSGADLEDRGITDIQSVVQSVPGVSMRTMVPDRLELEMRGMTSSGGNFPPAGFYLDDTPLSAPASAQNGKVVIDPNLYDLNRNRDPARASRDAVWRRLHGRHDQARAERTESDDVRGERAADLRRHARRG